MSLLKIIQEASKLVKINGKYFHYKDPNKHYLVLNVAISEATEKPVVIYKPLYGDKLIWTRDLDVWNSKITVEDKEVNRFTLIE